MLCWDNNNNQLCTCFNSLCLLETFLLSNQTRAWATLLLASGPWWISCRDSWFSSIRELRSLFKPAHCYVSEMKIMSHQTLSQGSWDALNHHSFTQHFHILMPVPLPLFSCWVVSDSFVTPWTVAHSAPLSMGFSRQEPTGVGCHFSLKRIFPTQRLDLGLLHWQVDSLPLRHQDGSMYMYNWFTLLHSTN